MKKSEIYYRMQVAVLHTCTMAAEEKLEVLRELMCAEDCAKLVEANEVKHAESVS